MDIVSQDIEKAELQASRDAARQSMEHGDGARRESYASSSSSDSSSTTSFDEATLSRIQTGPDLERHTTALSRIATQRSQHSATVGASIKSRSSKGLKPLPAFGGGKPYPPPLPEKEEYVVEFDGPDDPLHPQNWSTKRK